MSQCVLATEEDINASPAGQKAGLWPICSGMFIAIAATLCFLGAGVNYAINGVYFLALLLLVASVGFAVVARDFIKLVREKWPLAFPSTDMPEKTS
jgi:hypothetical protein